MKKRGRPPARGIRLGAYRFEQWQRERAEYLGEVRRVADACRQLSTADLEPYFLPVALRGQKPDLSSCMSQLASDLVSGRRRSRQTVERVGRIQRAVRDLRSRRNVASGFGIFGARQQRVATEWARLPLQMGRVERIYRIVGVATGWQWITIQARCEAMARMCRELPRLDIGMLRRQVFFRAKARLRSTGAGRAVASHIRSVWELRSLRGGASIRDPMVEGQLRALEKMRKA